MGFNSAFKGLISASQKSVASALQSAAGFLCYVLIRFFVLGIIKNEGTFGTAFLNPCFHTFAVL
jgi:hypothetical protein